MSHTRVPQQRYMFGETRLLMDYLSAAYPGLRWYTNIRVGPIEPHIPRAGLSEAAKKLLGAYRRYADAVVVTPAELVVVETTMVKAVQKVGPLLEYLDLVSQTPELTEVLGRPVRGELVSPIPDPRASDLCSRVGLRFVTFEPAWLDQFMEVYSGRFRRAPLSDRQAQFID